MEHKTALTVAAAVLAVGGSGAVALGTLTGAFGPNIDAAETVTVAAGQPAAVQPARSDRRLPVPRPVKRVTRYIDVPMPAPASLPSVAAPVAAPAPLVVKPAAPAAPVAPPAPPKAAPGASAGGPVSDSPVIDCASADETDDETDESEELREDRQEACEEAREARAKDKHDD